MSIERGKEKYGVLANAEGNALSRAKDVDLVTLPENVEGTNCGNCEYVNHKQKFCDNPKVLLPVSERMCCALWDAEGTLRAWENS